MLTLRLSARPPPDLAASMSAARRAEPIPRARAPSRTAIATSGTVLVRGVNPARAGHLGRIRMRRRISAVLDDVVHPAMPAESWVATGIWCAGENWAASFKRARGILEESGLAGEASKPFGALKPDRQAVLLLAAGLARKPALLLIDRAGFRGSEIPGELAVRISGFVREGNACLLAGEPPSWFSALGPRMVRMEGNRGA